MTFSYIYTIDPTSFNFMALHYINEEMFHRFTKKYHLNDNSYSNNK